MQVCADCVWRAGDGACHNVQHPDFLREVDPSGWCSLNPGVIRWETREFEAEQVPSGWIPFAQMSVKSVMCRRAVRE